MENWKSLYLFRHAHPGSVFDLLKKLRKKKSDYLDEDAVKREDVAFQRNDSIINLGLALYGSSMEVGQHLLNSTDVELRIACVSGTLLLPSTTQGEGFAKNILPDILNEKIENIKRSYFSNKHLPDQILKDLYKRNSPFNELDDEKWVMCCFYTATNPRITTPPDPDLLPHSELDYMEVINLVWTLFETFPVTSNSAVVLCSIARNLVQPTTAIKDFISVISRWHRGDESKDDFFYARYSYANHIQNCDSLFQSLKGSDDLALRCAYYRNNPYNKQEDISGDAAKDGTKFLDEAFGNRHIFRKEITRNALYLARKNVCKLVPDESDWYLTQHWQALSYWEQEHPEWFETEEMNLYYQPFEKIKNKSIRAEKQIGYLTNAVQQIKKKLDIELEDSESVIGIAAYCKAKFEANDQALKAITQKLHSNFIFFVFGLSIGYFFSLLF